MYFCLVYIDFDTFQKTKDVIPATQSTHSSIADEVRKALTVRNRELLVNPDCFTAIIMDYIFEAIGVDDKNRGKFDIMNEKGRLLNVQSYPQDYSGLNIFNDKGTYYIAYFDNNEVKPLLCKKSKEYVEVMERRKTATKKERRSGSRMSKGSAYNLSLMPGDSFRSLKSAPSKSKTSA